MDGHFHYNLFGTEEELAIALETITQKSKSNEDFEALLEFIDTDGIRDHYDGNHILEFRHSGNISSIPFLFDEMMSDLSKMFPDLEILGTGYNLDFPPYPEWKSQKGDNDYTDILVYEISESLNLIDYIDKNGAIIQDTIELECDCGDPIILSTQEIFNLNADNIAKHEVLFYDTEINCDTCGTVIRIELELY